MNKKILILNWRCPKNPLSGGAEKVTLEHAKAWVQNGATVTWLAGNYFGGKKNEQIDGVDIVRIGNPITIYLLALFFYWLNGGNFDLVVDEIHGIPFLSPLWAWKSKKLAYIHEVAQEIWDDMLPFPINILGKIYEKLYFVFYKSTPFLTGSNSTKEDLVRYGIPEKNITVLPHGLFLTPADSIPKKEKNLTLIFVGRLVKMKGIEDAIRIFAEIKISQKGARLWIVGAGDKEYVSYLRFITAQLKLQESIRFYGYVTEEKKRALLQKAHFLIHTSVREGFGLVVIEANSQGTPVLSYDSAGLRDIVINGVNGYLCKQGEYAQIAKKCISIYNDPIFRSLQQSSIDESKKYQWKTIVQKSWEIVKGLLH